jgi:hypothetical protein
LDSACRYEILRRGILAAKRPVHYLELRHSMASLARSFDKYAAYGQSVQSSRDEARFLRVLYRNINGDEPIVLREDFCGTFAMSCEWAKLGPEKVAIGLDLDPEPLEYGIRHHLSALTADAQSRVTVRERDVLARFSTKADIIAALNFSYFAFHSRETLVQYFTACRKALRKSGLLVVDTFGGPQHGEPSSDSYRFPKFTYYFEQEHFDPISNRSRFSILFKPKGSQRRTRAFTYDWRLWSIAEIRDAMLDAGFKHVDVYWEGTGRDGRGSGRFSRREKGEPCQVWVAYLVAR